MHKKEINYDKKLYEYLKVDCEKCFGFCCVALYFSASDGFPTDKVAGKPCINLKPDFKCAVHNNLIKKGLKGCTAYDCFGAGQQVAQITYKGQDWRQNPKNSKEMFDVFLVMRQLYEMLWYLTEAFRIQNDNGVKIEIKNMINETIRLTNLDSTSLIALDLIVHRHKVNPLLLKTSEALRSKTYKEKKSVLKRKKSIAGRLDLIGANLTNISLVGEDLNGAFLIAANLNGVDLSGTDLLGADLRGADIRGANLTKSIFITQGQVNAANGDSNTRLPISLVRPSHWEK